MSNVQHVILRNNMATEITFIRQPRYNILCTTLMYFANHAVLFSELQKQ